MLLDRFPDLAQMNVLDLGGNAETWLHAPVRPARVTILNLEDPAAEMAEGMESVVGDACDPPASIRRQAFDLVYCNSVIEHVGGFRHRVELARAVQQLAPRYWVQTPNRYFPIEPHWLFPGFQFLPLKLRAAISRRWPVGHIRSADAGAAIDDVLGVDLLTGTEMARLFPDAVLVSERFAGLTKSLIAVRG